MRVAIVCSGLGRVRRGNESWAQHTAEELHAAGTDVTLFGGAPRLPAACPYVHIPNIPRETPGVRRLLSWHRRYLIEQLSAAAALHVLLRRRHFDVVHVPDPALAWRLHASARLLRTRVVYKDGLLLGPSWLKKFDFVQVLAPWYRDAATAAGVDAERCFAIPHMAKVDRFHPVRERSDARKRLLGDRVEPDAFVVLGVGDFAPASNKRLEWLVQEVALLPPEQRAHLVLVGQANREDLRAFERRANAVLPGRVHIVANVEAEAMSSWYQMADVFAHAALREPFGIVFLEAMACGLPVVGHRYPVTEWIMGEGGVAVDMTAAGELAGVLAGWAADPAARSRVGTVARETAEARFSPERIVPLYQRMYEQVARA